MSENPSNGCLTAEGRDHSITAWWLAQWSYLFQLFSFTALTPFFGLQTRGTSGL